MSKNLKNRKEVPIPHNALGGSRIYIYLDSTAPCRGNQKIYIGTSVGNGMMRPNDNFGKYFPELAKKWTGESPARHTYSVGLYSLVLGISHRTGLYDSLVSSYGPQYANAILDFATYCIKSRSNVAQHFEGSMDGSVLFSERAYSDSWYGDMFGAMTDEQGEMLMESWMGHVREGLEGNVKQKVYIAIDGSNSDSDVKDGSLLPRHGHAKSGSSSKVVAYIYGVLAPSGLPLTFDVFRGNMVDSKAMLDMKVRLERCGFEVEGLLIDRFFCNEPLLKRLKDDGWDYVVKMKEGDTGFKYMFGKYASQIKDRFKYLVSGDGVFGITSRGSIFKGSEEVHLGLFYDNENGGDRVRALTKKIWKALRSARESISKGKEPSIPAEMGRYLRVVKDKSGKVTWVEAKEDACQEAMDCKGFFAIGSTLDMSAEELNQTYNMRDVSEKCYSMVGTQLGNNVTRTHRTPSIKAKHVISFVASILRCHIMNLCAEMDLPTNEVIHDLGDIHLRLAKGDSYAYVHSASVAQLQILGRYGITEETMGAIAADFNLRKSGESAVSDNRSLVLGQKPGIPAIPAKLDVREEHESTDGNPPVKDMAVEKRKRGRPKDRKDAKPRHRRTNEELGKTPAKRKRKPKSAAASGTEQEVAKEEQTVAGQVPSGGNPDKPRRGRPKGSKNKKTLLLEEERAKVRQEWENRHKKGAKASGKSGNESE